MRTRAFLVGVALSLMLLIPVARPQSQAPSGSKSDLHDFSKESYVIEQLHTSARFEADGTGQRELSVRVRVQSEAAVRQFGLLVYPYMADFESLDVVHARVRKPDGTVVDTPVDEIQDLDSAVSREAPMYTDQREKHIPVKSLAVGDVLEAELRWTARQAIAPGHFWFDDNFFESGICLDEQLEINVPANVPTKISSPKVSPGVKTEGSRKIYTFHTSHLEKTDDKPDDQKIPAWEANFHGIDPPAIRISSFTSWAELGAWYAALQQSRVQVTPKIRSIAQDITKGNSTDDEKIRAIYDYVASRYRYIGVDLGVGLYTPHTAEDVLANRYGDCKDKHTLFAALLEAVDLHAYPALISNVYRMDTDMPSPSSFNHVISAIPKGDSYLFLDTTPEVAPYGLLVASLRDRHALVIPSNAPARLALTPPDPPMLNSEKYKIDASIDLQGTLDGTARFEDRGDPELLLRLAYRNTPENQWKELAQGLISRVGFGGTVSQAAAAAPEKTSEPFWFSYDYHRTDYSSWKEHRITLPFPFIFLAELNEAQKKSKDPLPMGSPQEVMQEASLKLPPGINAVAPPNIEQKTDFGEFTATYHFDHDVLYGSRHLSIKVREIPGSQRAAYAAFVKAIQDDAEQWVFLIGDFEQASPLRKANDLLNQGKVAEAVTLLESSLSEDPSNQWLIFTLGTAYLRVPDAPKAFEQFDKIVAGKTSANMLNSIAYTYADSNLRIPDAVSLASRAVSLTSSTSMTADLNTATPADFLHMSELAAEWDTLGWAKFRCGDTVEAEKYIRSSWLLQQNAVVGEHLVEVYEKLGKHLEAQKVSRVALIAPGLNSEPGIKDKLEAASKRTTAPKSPATAPANPHFFSATDPVALQDMRTLKVPRKIPPPEKSRIALFAMSIENGQTAAKVRYISGDEGLKSEIPLLQSLDYHQPFPDNVPVRILRMGYLSCSKYSTDCTLILFLPDDKSSADLINH
jgi:tetratricopeptide (TPR) repeat protein